MAKVHPFLPANCDESSACSSSTASKAESFTIWMKSLVMQANGCTVYNENGDIVYRVDNYDQKGSTEVFVMDFNGRVLFTIRKQMLFGRWRGYKCEEEELKLNTQRPFFEVKKSSIFIKNNLCCKISIRSGSCEDGCYKLEASSASKQEFKIINSNGQVVAKATRKQTSSGVVLGDDVMKLMVEPHVDSSFIMAIVTVYGLMMHRL